jgi:molybdopterin-guanine dinucleotide biosynthesis protein A
VTGAEVVVHAAIVLAGGRGARMGGVDKGALSVGGTSLLERAVTATAGARSRVVVGPQRPGFEGVHWTLEEPAGGGPVAGIVAGLAALPADVPWVVLAVDQPGVEAAVPALLRAAAQAGPDVDVLCPRDGEGHPQWLLAAYRGSALRQAVSELGTGHGVSVRRAVSGLRSAEVVGVAEHLGDVDTPEDLRRWRDTLG